MTAPIQPWVRDAPPFSIFDEDDPREQHATVQLITFRLGSTWCGVDVRDVHAVEGAVDVAEVPRAAPWLLGITNLRGEIASVVDLAALLEMGGEPGGASPAGRRGLVCRSSGGTYVLQVDEASQIVRIPVADIRSPHGTFESEAAAHLRGLHIQGATTLYVFDVASIVQSKTLLEGAIS